MPRISDWRRWWGRGCERKGAGAAAGFFFSDEQLGRSRTSATSPLGLEVSHLSQGFEGDGASAPVASRGLVVRRKKLSSRSLTPAPGLDTLDFSNNLVDGWIGTQASAPT